MSGTIWLTEDRCDGTYFKAKKDDVYVVAFAHPHHRHHLLQGQSILIPAPVAPERSKLRTAGMARTASRSTTNSPPAPYRVVETPIAAAIGPAHGEADRLQRERPQVVPRAHARLARRAPRAAAR